MKKIKKLVALLAATILSLGVCVFAACGDKDNDNNNDNNTNVGDTNTGDENVDDRYVIYVKDTNGNPIANLNVSICGYNKETGEKDDVCKMPKPTDANGKVEFGGETAPEAVYVFNTDPNLIGDYQAKETYIFEDYGVYTVVLEKKAN